MQFEKHCWAEIDLDAVRHNYRLVKAASGGEVMAVVKADAYGHGAAPVARVLREEGAGWFAVSCLAEALELRRADISCPVLILGHTQPSQAARLAEEAVRQTVYSAEYARALSARAVKDGVTVRCHLKLDTGMGRLGFCVRSEEAVEQAVQEILPVLELPGLSFEGAFIHFAAADSNAPDDVAYTERQYHLFRLLLSRLEQAGHTFPLVHCCNSAASFTRPQWRHSLVRPGIVLYGCQPSNEVKLEGLRPVLAFKTVVTHVKWVQPGETLSYGRTFAPDHPIRVATLAAGYADGYPRGLSGKGMARIGGADCPVLGRVCMDQLMVDVSALPDVQRGDEAVLFGAGGAQTVDQAADLCGTIGYELLCHISRRVPRLYLDGGRNFLVNHLA